MALLIDTSLLIAIERGDVSPDVLGSDARAISVVSVSELLHGVFRARSPVRTRRRLATDKLLKLFDALPVTEDIARLHAELGAELASDGMTIPTNDLWIGCTALFHDAGVATRDRRSLGRIPGLRVVTP
ncbi:MAG: PIN domain-containing protein [Gaiellaceae bacterium]